MVAVSCARAKQKARQERTVSKNFLIKNMFCVNNCFQATLRLEYHSGRNGIYIFNDLPAGDYSIQASKYGYKTTETPAYTVSGSTVRTDIVMTPDPNAVQKYTAPAMPQVQTAGTEQPSARTEQQTVTSPGKDPLNTVRNGLAAYFRFNGTTRSDVSAIQGNPINGPQYTTDSPDGTQAIALSSIDGSQIVFPKSLIVYPNNNYSVTFWMKGFSDGHVWSMACGDYRYNYPKLTIKDGKFFIYNVTDYTGSSFSHPALDYNWHFIAIVVRSEGSTVMGSLYIDGVLVFPTRKWLRSICPRNNISVC